MTYDVSHRARSWPAFLLLAVITAGMLWVSLAGYACCFAIFWPVLIWAFWCILRDKKWRLHVTDSEIIWNPLLLGRERRMQVNDIAAIDHHLGLEGDHWFRIRFKNGRRKGFVVPFKTQEAFINAVLAVNPAIEFRRIGPGWKWNV